MARLPYLVPKIRSQAQRYVMNSSAPNASVNPNCTGGWEKVRPLIAPNVIA